MLTVKQAEHQNGHVRLVYSDGEIVHMPEDRYEAFLDFAVDRFDQKLTRMREILDDFKS